MKKRHNIERKGRSEMHSLFNSQAHSITKIPYHSIQSKIFQKSQSILIIVDKSSTLQHRLNGNIRASLYSIASYSHTHHWLIEYRLKCACGCEAGEGGKGWRDDAVRCDDVTEARDDDIVLGRCNLHQLAGVRG